MLYLTAMLVTKIQEHIQQHFPEMLTAKLLLAVSAGVDSMVMLHVLLKLNANITVAHCNFKLRGNESDAETDFLKAYLEQNKIPHHIKYFDTELYAASQNLSIQLAARKLRYDWFYDLLATNELDFILTAHHLDDQIETFLINLTRGTGIEGLLGIPAKNDKILRPLLNVSRNEILEYAQSVKLEWREDSSNSSTKYFRNKIRHQVVPVLKTLNPDFLTTFSNTLKHLNQFNDGFTDGFEKLKNQIVTTHNEQLVVDIDKLEQIKSPQAFLYYFLKPYQFTAWNDIFNLMYADSGKVIYANSGYSLLKNRRQLLVKRNDEPKQTQFIIHSLADLKNLPIPIAVNQNQTEMPNGKLAVNLDLEMLKFPLIVRNWQQGDYFYPFGMIGKKKLAKFYKDEKFSQFQKNETWLLVQNNNTDIIWIIGHRADKRYMATQNSNTTILLQFLK